MTRFLIAGFAAIAAASCQTVDVAAPQPASQATVAEVPAFDPAKLMRDGAEVLFWSQEERLDRFQRMAELFPGTRIAPVAPRPLDRAAPLASNTALAQLMDEHDLVGMMVLKDGVIRFESYHDRMGPTQEWPSFSVAKSVTSLLVGAALADGHIASLDDPATRYVPELAGTAYDGVSLEDLLTMRSGVAWDENYADPNSDIAQLYSQPYREGVDLNLAYLATLEKAAEPGTDFNYNTAETNLVGLIVERATGQRLADYAAEKIVGPAGLEGSLFWQVDPMGGNVGGCCISMRLSDYARLGQWILEGAPDGKGGYVVSPDFLAAATSKQAALRGGAGYGYFWWTQPGIVSAVGIFGQGVHLDPANDVVIAYLGNWPQASGGDRAAIVRGALAALAN